MENDKYILTLAIPTYNSKNYIQPLLDSLKCIWNNDEIKILFIDDGSTDKTSEYIKTKVSKYSNVKVHSENKNRGLTFIRKKATSLLETKWIWHIDSDDNLINPEKINDILTILKTTKNTVISFKYIITQGNNKDIPPVRNRLISRIKNKNLTIEYSCNNTHKIPLIDFTWNKIIHISVAKKNPLIQCS